MASAAVCSSAACMPGPKARLLDWVPRAATAFCDPCPAPRFPRFWGHSSLLLGETTLVVCRELPMVPHTLSPRRDRVEHLSGDPLVQSQLRLRTLRKKVPMEKGDPPPEVGLETFNGLPSRTLSLLHTCLADDKVFM
jgi:hypothetical protein